jgi:hypothetical protein
MLLWMLCVALLLLVAGTSLLFIKQFCADISHIQKETI